MHFTSLKRKLKGDNSRNKQELKREGLQKHFKESGEVSGFIASKADATKYAIIIFHFKIILSCLFQYFCLLKK